jgi:membrane-bound serine protease (ClpP class)
MRRLCHYFARAIMAACCAVALFAGVHAAGERVVVVSVDGAITPATADYVIRALGRAEQEKAELVVLELDTPGGLDPSMRSLIKAILASRVPVATFVAPDGARAASAGTYILYASHIAAMAPATNLGAATPVSIGGGGDDDAGHDDRKSSKGKSYPSTRESLRSKQINDAAAYIRGLAHMRGRNPDWAERAVREAVSLPATEALRLDVIDLIARDDRDLLRQLDGRRVSAAGAERVLHTASAEITRVAPDWRTRLLMIVTDPSVAVILMMIGIYGLLFEFMSPGFVLPGVLGGISLVVALYALQLMPVNYAGVALIMLGAVFLVGEAFMPSFGALGLGGIASIAIGMFVLVDPETAPGLAIPFSFIAGFTLLASAAVFLTAWIALKARRRPVVTGREQLEGAEGVMLENCDGEGWARVHGETWRVASAVPLRAGERVRVKAVKGLTLTVERS